MIGFDLWERASKIYLQLMEKVAVQVAKRERAKFLYALFLADLKRLYQKTRLSFGLSQGYDRHVRRANLIHTTGARGPP